MDQSTIDILSPDDIHPPLSKKRIRVFAILIDYAIFFGFFVFMDVFFGERYDTYEGNTEYQLTGIPALICFLFWFILFPMLEGLFGQTIGKMILKIELRSQNYSKATFGQAIVKHLFDFVDSFFLGLVGMIVASNNALQQRVGDLVAKTVVVNK